MYRQVPDDPTIPQEQKKFYERRESGRPPQQSNPILNLQLYPEQRGKPSQPQPTKMDPYTMMQHANPVMFTHMMSMLPPPVINKEYNINITGPTGDHIKAGHIFEDEVPDINMSGTSLRDRITFEQYIRSILFPQGDGQNAELEGLGYRSILNHLKFLNLNPYNRHRFTSNPYKGLPDGFLIYRSCWPIRHNQRAGNIVCSKDSMGVNVRLYRMVEGAYLISTQNITSFEDYDSLRELGFYQFLREKILRNKVCPNFVMLFGYYISIKSGIDYNKIDRVKNVKSTVMDLRPWEKCGLMSLKEQEPIRIGGKEIQMEVDLNSYTGKTLVLITESPTYNIMDWSSTLYQRDGPVRRMINTGFHHENAWMSVIFQIMVGLFVMQLNKVFINRMTLDKNVFIKELSDHGNVTGHWKYIIDGVEYYIPNYGYLVMLDSNYGDLNDGRNPPNYRTNIRFKIEGDIFETGEGGMIAVEEMFRNMTMMLNRDNFSDDFTKQGGVKPPESVLNIFDQIFEESKKSKPNQDIGHYITRFMGRFVHNRVGTYLKDKEIQNKRTDSPEFQRGDMVIRDMQNDTYKFAIYLGMDTDPHRAHILFRDKPEDKIRMDTVNISRLSGYSSVDPIEQDFKANQTNLSELIETYVVNIR